MIPKLIPVLGSQPSGDVSHKPGGRLPLLSARPAVTPTSLRRAAANFAAWWTESRWVWTVCLRQRRSCHLKSGPSAPESSTLTTRLPSHYKVCVCIQESHKHVDDADLEVEIQRELEEEEEALRSAWKTRQREQSSLLYSSVSSVPGQGTNVCRYNWHTAGSLGWPIPVLKYKYIFEVKYTETILFDQTALRNCYGLKTPKCWFQFQKNFLCHLL